jgi:predicted enzyme related to lactoylglutathione lyase
VGKVVNFHLPADDVERAAKFYHEVFGWRFQRFPDSPVPYLVADADGQNGSGIPAAITQRQEIVKAPVPTIEVENIDQAMLDIAMKGGQQARVQDIEGLGRFGYAVDSEGNIIALVQRAATS